MKNPALVILAAVAVLGAVIALVLFSMITGGLFDTYDVFTMTTDRPSLALVLVPLGVAVAAGVGALVLWGTQRTRSA